jgi:hypothetical protein
MTPTIEDGPEPLAVYQDLVAREEELPDALSEGLVLFGLDELVALKAQVHPRLQVLHPGKHLVPHFKGLDVEEGHHPPALPPLEGLLVE